MHIPNEPHVAFPLYKGVCEGRQPCIHSHVQGALLGNASVRRFLRSLPPIYTSPFDALGVRASARAGS